MWKQTKKTRKLLRGKYFVKIESILYCVLTALMYSANVGLDTESN